MVCLHILTRLREQTLLVLTYTMRHLLLTGRMTEVSSRTAYVMDISFKIRLFDEKFSFFYNGVMASNLYGTSWWKVSAQKLHPPKHPLLLIREYLISAIAGTPPASS